MDERMKNDLKAIAIRTSNHFNSIMKNQPGFDDDQQKWLDLAFYSAIGYLLEELADRGFIEHGM